MMDYTQARTNMVESQIRPNKVTNPLLLTAMLNLPRERFVPKAVKGIAYVDEDVPIGEGRFLMEPMVLARLLEEARISADDMVLDVACGPGYSTAIVARMANTVVAVEDDPDLAARATALLAEFGVDNAVVVEGPTIYGYRAQAPYQVILIGGGVAEVPSTLTDQLSDGGRLVTVLTSETGMGHAVLIERVGDVLSRRTLFDAACPWLPGFEPKPAFEF